MGSGESTGGGESGSMPSGSQQVAAGLVEGGPELEFANGISKEERTVRATGVPDARLERLGHHQPKEDGETAGTKHGQQYGLA
jgi:hypothetical protein